MNETSFEEKALKMINESQMEFENHPLWRKMGVKPAQLFEATHKYVAEKFDRESPDFKKKYERLKNEMRTKSVEKNKHYMDGHKTLRLMSSLRV